MSTPAIEIRLFAYQTASQVAVVRTGNADSNAGMLKINHELGFKPFMAECFWQVERTQVEAYLGQKEE